MQFKDRENEKQKSINFSINFDFDSIIGDVFFGSKSHIRWSEDKTTTFLLQVRFSLLIVRKEVAPFCFSLSSLFHVVRFLVPFVLWHDRISRTIVCFLPINKNLRRRFFRNFLEEKTKFFKIDHDFDCDYNKRQIKLRKRWIEEKFKI